MSQLTLAQKIGVDQALISKFENGDKEPTAESWERIASTLNIPIDVIFAPPPISFGGTTDAITHRTTSELPNGDGTKSRKARRPQGFGRVTFLTPSQARVKMQLRKTIKLSDEEWDGVEVFVELPCEDDPDAIREAKAEAVKYCQDFIEEEIGRITQDYINQFNRVTVERVESGEESGVSEGTG